MASASYAQLVAKTSSLLFDHEDLKGIITAAKAGDMLAVLDRNDLEGEWRNARLLRLEDTTEEVQWRLLTEDGVVIDEPGDGCPAAGFSTEDLLADVGMTYYISHDNQAASAEVVERARRAHMLVKAHGRRRPTAGRFGFFGAILVVN